MRCRDQRRLERALARKREKVAAAQAKVAPSACTVTVCTVEEPKPKSAAKKRREARLAHERGHSVSRKGAPALGPRNGVQRGVADPFACDETVLQRAGADELEYEAEVASMLESMFNSSSEKAA